MNRLEATRIVVELAGDAPIVASLGHPAYDLFAAGDRPQNFYTWGSMGLASSIGLGLALARPELRVFVLDGDGSLLMNLGSLATIGFLRPANLVLVVMDNETYATTGGQPTPTAGCARLPSTRTIARPRRADAKVNGIGPAYLRASSQSANTEAGGSAAASLTATSNPLDVATDRLPPSRRMVAATW